MKGHIRRLAIVLFALLCLSSLAQALMRIYSNVPISSFPQAMRDAASGHFFNEGYLNVKSAPYNAKGDSVGDDSSAFLAAIHDAYANNLVVYVPSGTYLIPKQLRLVQTPQGGFPGQRKFAHIMVGQKSANGRPVLKLKDGTLLPGPFIEFVHENIDSSGSPVSAPESHYNATFRGLSIDMGNNPTQTALSMSGAQYCVIEDANIFGNFDTGIFQLPGSGGSVTNVQIVGGKIGILQDDYRPNPLITGLSLIGQSLYGIQLLTSRGPLTVVGFHIESPAAPSISYRALNLTNTSTFDPAEANLNLLDGDILIRGPGIPAIENFDQDLYAHNVYIRSDIMIRSGLRKAPAEILSGSASAYKRIGEYVFAGGTDDTHVFADGKELAHQGIDFATASGLSDSAPPADLISRHIWNEAGFPEFRDADVVNIVRDYGATPDNEGDDDAIAIQRAINDTTSPGNGNFGKAVFVPRGHFHIKQPLFVHGGARMFGASNTISVIEISQFWQPAAPTGALVTDDVGNSTLLLANFAILDYDPTPFKGVASHKYISQLAIQTNNTLLRDLQFSVKEFFRSDNVYQEPRIVLKGNAGGHFYNVALDDENDHSTGTMSPHYRLIAVRGTFNLIQMYQPDTEHMTAGPQMEVSSARNVFLYAYKYESANRLFTLLDSSNVGLFGGSGNYSLYEPGESSIFSVARSSNYVLANMARKPDPSNPRDQPNAAQFDVISDGVNHVSADQNNLTLFKSGDVSFPEAGQPFITLVANAFGDTPLIAPNTWLEIKGSSLAPPGDTRIWQDPDFASGLLPAQLDGVSSTVNGKSAYVYYISPTQIDILSAPEALPSPAMVQVTVGGVKSNIATVNTQPLSLSFFEFVSSDNKHYVYGRHPNGDLIGPPGLFPTAPSITTPVKPGEAIYIAATGFGPTNVPVVSGSISQSGTLPAPLPVVKVGGITAVVSFAGLVGVGTYQINFVVPSNAPDGDLALTATYGGSSIQSSLLITVKH